MDSGAHGRFGNFQDLGDFLAAQVLNSRQHQRAAQVFGKRSVSRFIASINSLSSALKLPARSTGISTSRRCLFLVRFNFVIASRHAIRASHARWSQTAAVGWYCS